MTTRRRLKKEIDYVVSDLILDCMTYANLYQKSDDKEALGIVQDTLDMRNTLRNMTNHPELRSKKETVKNYYDSIALTLVEGVDKGYGKLGKLVNKDV